MRFNILLLGLLICSGAGAQEEDEVPFTAGPTNGQLGKVASIDVPAGYSFVDKSQMESFNLATGNLHNPKDVGALFPTEGDWVAFFSFDPIGYVKDAEDEKLDAAALLASFKESDGPSNEARRDQGFDELYTVGWSREPFYDPQTNNLTWGLELRSSEGSVINHQIRVLGRRGVMSVILAAPPESINDSIAAFEPVLASYEFTSGNRYAEFTTGDKVATYGLTGLVLGGGAMMAAKTGLLAKLGKFLKVIVIAVAAGVAAIGRFLRGLFSGRQRQPSEG
jgi:uncharacterized membrane-anchored protein